MSSQLFYRRKLATYNLTVFVPDESTVTTAKKNDLLRMRSELIIPRNYHDFYHGLRMTNSASVDVESDEMNAEKKRHQHKC